MVVDPSVQRENLVAYVSAGMMTRRRAAEIMGETLPDDPMADVLAVTTGQGVARLGGNPAKNLDCVGGGINQGEQPVIASKRDKAPAKLPKSD